MHQLNQAIILNLWTSKEALCPHHVRKAGAVRREEFGDVQFMAILMRQWLLSMCAAGSMRAAPGAGTPVKRSVPSHP
jgi:hypothetical protein